MSRVKDPLSQRGAALLSVLLIVSAMSIAALITIDAISRSMALTRTASARTQALWHTRSAEAFASVAIVDILKPLDHKIVYGMPGLSEPVIFELEGGILTTQIHDVTNCFNLNALAAGDGNGGWEIDSKMLTRYRALLISIGIFDSDADALADWLDSDTISRPRGGEDGYYISLVPPYRTAGTLLDNFSELRSILGYTDEVIETIRPYVCVRPDTEEATLNVNMLSVEDAPVLIALFAPQLELDVVREIIAQRPQNGWASDAEFLSIPAIQVMSLEYKRPERISVQSSWFLLEGQVAYGGETAAFETLFRAVPGNSAEAVWRRYGGE